MAKKFIEFLEAAALIILTGVIVVGVMKYVDTKEEPKEEDQIVDTEPKEEIYEVKVNSTGPSFAVNETKILKYEEGITWEEFLELNADNISTSNSFNEDGYLVCGAGYWCIGSTEINKNDLVNPVFDGNEYLINLKFRN